MTDTVEVQQRSIIVVTLRENMQKDWIFNSFSKLKERSIEEVYEISAYRWLLYFYSASDDLLVQLKSKKELSVAINEESRCTSFTIEEPDEKTVEEYMKNRCQINPERDSLCSILPGIKASAGPKTATLPKMRTVAETGRLVVSTTFDFPESNNLRLDDKLAQLDDYEPLVKSSLSASVNNATLRKVKSLNASQSSCFSYRISPKKINLLECSLMSRDSQVNRRVSSQFSVQLHYELQRNQPVLIIEGPSENLDDALTELLKIAADLKHRECLLNAGQAWLLLCNDEASASLHVKLSENGIPASWNVSDSQYSRTLQSTQDIIAVQKGSVNLLDCDVAVWVCAAQKTAFDNFPQYVESLFRTEIRTLKIQTLQSDAWAVFLDKLASKYPGKFYVYSDLNIGSCTLVALPELMQELLNQLQEVQQRDVGKTLILSVDERMCTCVHRLRKEAVREISSRYMTTITFLRGAVQLVGEESNVKGALDEVCALFDQVQTTTLTFSSITLSRILKHAAVVDEVESRRGCVMQLKLSQRQQQSMSQEVLRYRFGKTTVVVSCMFIVENRTDVVGCFADSRLTDDFSTTHLLLMRSAGRRTAAECGGRNLQVGDVFFSGSGDLHNYKRIAHMCVQDAGSPAGQKEPYGNVMGKLLRQCGEENLKSVTLPVPYNAVCTIVLQALRRFVDSSAKSLQGLEVHFVHPLFDVANVFASTLCSAFEIHRVSHYPADLSSSIRCETPVEAYSFSNGLQVQMVYGDLQHMNVQGVATFSTDVGAFHSDLMSARFLNSDGNQVRSSIKLQLANTREQDAKVALVVVPGNSAGSSCLLVHMQLKPFDQASESSEKLLRHSLRRSIKLARSKSVESLAISVASLTSSKLKYPLDTVARATLDALRSVEESRDSTKLIVMLVMSLGDREALQVFRTQFASKSATHTLRGITKLTKLNLGNENNVTLKRLSLIDERTSEVVLSYDGVDVLYICAPVVLSNSSADALLHLVDRERKLNGPVSLELLTALGTTTAQLLDSIDHAPRRNNMRYTSVIKSDVPFGIVLHANSDANVDVFNSYFHTSEKKALEAALHLCEDLCCSSVTVPLVGASIDWTSLMSTVSHFVATRKRCRLNTIKFVSSIDLTTDCLSKLKQQPARSMASVWKGRSNNTLVRLVIYHFGDRQMLVSAVKSDLQWLICNGEHDEVMYQVRQRPLSAQQAITVPTAMAILPRTLCMPSMFDNHPLKTLEPETLVVSDYRLGEGQFGSVCCGVHTVNDVSHEVAVKQVPHWEISNVADLMNEAELLSKLDHQNIVKIFGISNHNGMLRIVMERINMSSLRQYLLDNQGNIESAQILVWMHQVADGMAYLESQRILHRNLTARNVLLESSIHCKITDFALSRRLRTNNDVYLMRRPLIPVRWYPPESLGQEPVFKLGSDSWSYGVLLWETYSHGRNPYADCPNLDNAAEMFAFLKAGNRLPRPLQCPEKVYKLMLNCWEWNMNRRPLFKELNSSMSAFVAASDFYV